MTLHDEIAALYSDSPYWLDTEFWVDGEAYIKAAAALAIVDAHRCGPTESELAAALHFDIYGHTLPMVSLTRHATCGCPERARAILAALHPEPTERHTITFSDRTPA